MTKTSLTKCLGGSALMMLCAAGSANADTVSGQYVEELGQTVTITSPVLNGFVPTVRFGWTRNDTPGPGVDALLPSQFKAWCVDLSQPLAPDVTFSFDVVELAASGYTPTRADLLNGLFNEYFPIVNTAQESAAFQLAIWEILYDTDGSLDTGTFRATTQALTVSLANSWLANITSSAFERGIDQWRVLVLQKPVIQDQITAVRIPSPGVGVCAAGGLLLAAGRRRRRAG